MATYNGLMNAPLVNLATNALDFTMPRKWRLPYWEALCARSHELNGARWTLLQPIERDKISRALALEFAQPIETEPRAVAA